jgi:hypothetical protein
MVDLLIGMTLSTLLLLAIGLATRGSTDAFGEGLRASDLDTRLQRGLERLLDPLSEAQLSAFPVLADGAATLTYHTAVSHDADLGTQWGPDERIEWEREPGELDDGLDNDGDGLTDEGQVVWTLSPGTADERRVVVCRGVNELLDGELPNGLDDNGNGQRDERGFWIDVQGDVLTVRLNMGAASGGRVLQRTMESSVRIRN